MQPNSCKQKFFFRCLFSREADSRRISYFTYEFNWLSCLLSDTSVNLLMNTNYKWNSQRFNGKEGVHREKQVFVHNSVLSMLLFLMPALIYLFVFVICCLGVRPLGSQYTQILFQHYFLSFDNAILNLRLYCYYTQRNFWGWFESTISSNLSFLQPSKIPAIRIKKLTLLRKHHKKMYIYIFFLSK